MGRGGIEALLHQNGGIVNQISATSERLHTYTRMQGEELKSRHIYVLVGKGNIGEYIISLKKMQQHVQQSRWINVLIRGTAACIYRSLSSS